MKVDEAGEKVSYDDYDPWGMILNGRSTNAAYLNAKYKFTGKERDTETGYDYFGARLYDDELGIFYATDPAGQEFIQAIDFYEDKDAGLGRDFALEIYSTVERILTHPDSS